MTRFHLTHYAGMLAAVLCVSAALAATTYTYDELGRVVSATYDNGNQIIYTYDSAGNRTAKSVATAAASQVPVATANTRTLTQHAMTTTTTDVFDPRAATGTEGADTGPSGQTLTIVSVTPGQYGKAAVTDSGHSVTYTTNVNRIVTDEVVYTIQTNGSPPQTATGVITYNLVNPAPIAVDDWWGISVERLGSDSRNLASNDSDPDADPFLVTAASGASHGTLTITSAGAAAGWVYYNANTGYSGTDTFTYTVTDADGGTATATAHIRVNNHGPDTADHWYRSVPPNGSLGFNPRGGQTQDQDTDAVIISAVGVSSATHGTVTIATGGTSVTYQPASGFSGTATFTYTLAETYGETKSNTVTMCVSSANCAPVAIDDEVGWTYHGGSSNRYTDFDPRMNDADPDVDAISILSVTQPTDGSTAIVTVNGIQKIRFTLPYEVPPVANFTYTIKDIHNATATASVTIDIGCDATPNECHP